ncbi:hypothetical protein FRC03_001871 [Tulasnella sp. 419]|nr:hypothetical protein FRC03_001871 [Tulasnella sp. 419]
MTKTLKRDLCDIRDPSKFNSEITDLPERLKEHLPQHVKYACLYWASHLGKASSADDDIRICLTEFCETKLLQWMEVMSLLGDLPSAVHSLKLAEQYILASSSLHHLLHLVQDCHRFLLKYYEPISLSAAHIYYSALPFMPNSTLLETYGHEVGSSVRLLAGRKPSWSLCTRTLELGTGIAQSVTISPNGLTFASGHVNAVVRIWDVATGVVIMELNAHEKPITSVAYSPDGSIIASGSDDNSVRTWDVKTGKVGATWRGDDSHSDHRVICLTFSCDGRYIAFGSSNKLVRIWDLLQDPEAQYVVELKGHMGRITSLRFSPDGTQLATASNDHTVRIWTMEDVLRKEPEKVIDGVGNETNGEDSDRMKAIVLLGHFFSINSVRYSSDGARIVTGSDDRSIRIWDSRTGHQIRVIYCHTKVSTLTVVDDGDYHYIVSGCEDSTIRVFDASSGELRATLEGHFGRAESINLSLAHNLMISSSSDFTIRLWNWSASLRDARAIVPPRASAIVGVSFSPNGNWIGAASVDGKVQLYRRDGVLITTLDSEARSWDSGAGFLFSPDSSRILTRRLDDMLLHLWDTSDGALIARPDAEDQSVSLDRVCFSPNNALLAAWSDSNDILLWETVNGTPIVTLRGHVETIRSVAFSPDSRRLVSGSDDGRILVWDTMRHQLIMGLFGHDSPVVELMFSADGGVIMSRSKTKGFICWNAMTFKNIGGNPNTPVPYSSQTETGGRFNRGQWVGNWRIELEKDWMVLRSKPNAKGERMQKRLCWVPSTLRGRPLSSNRAEIRWDSHGSVAVCGVHTRRLAILDFSAMLELILGPRWNEE